MTRKKIINKYVDALSVAIELNNIELINILNQAIFENLPFLNDDEKDYYLYVSDTFKDWQEYKNIVFKILSNIDYKMISCNYLTNYKLFDRFDKKMLTKSQFKKLYNKAKKLYYEVTNRNDFTKQVCFISSNDLQGFYFPNIEQIKCISFIDGKPFAIM